MLFFNAVNLAMTAVTGYYQHPGTRSLDLVHFSSGIKYSFFIVTRYQCTATAATANLVHIRRIKVGPVIHTLAEDPAWFFKIPVSKPLLGSSAIIARIVVGCRSFKPCFVQFDAPLFNIPYEKIKYRDKFEFFKYFRMVFFETRPGRKVSVPSLRPHQGLDLQLLHMFHNTIAHDFHGLVIAGKIGPVGSFPVFRRHCPVFPGHVKNPPPVL